MMLWPRDITVHGGHTGSAGWDAETYHFWTISASARPASEVGTGHFHIQERLPEENRRSIATPWSGKLAAVPISTLTIGGRPPASRTGISEASG